MMSKADLLMPGDYASLLAEVKERVRAAQYKALRAVNKELIGLYWDIGRMICERQAGGASWGKSVVERLAADLRAEFPEVQGFSSQSLWYMRQFHRAYQGHEKLQPLVGEISWTKHLVILGKCDDPLEREFYIRSTKKFGWTKSVPANGVGYRGSIDGCSPARDSGGSVCDSDAKRRRTHRNSRPSRRIRAKRQSDGQRFNWQAALRQTEGTGPQAIRASSVPYQ